MTKPALIFAFVILMAFTACHRESRLPATIQGRLPGGAGMKLILEEMDTHAIHPFDSITLDPAGSFTFKIPVTSAGFWTLRAPSGKILTLLLYQGNRIELAGSFIDFPDRVQVKGPEEAMRLQEFFSFTRKQEKQVDSLEMMLIAFQDQEGYYELTQKIDTLFKKIWDKQRGYEMEFIRKYPSSPASLIVLNYAFGLSPVLSPQEDLEWYMRVDSALQLTLSDNKHVKYHHQRIGEYLRNQGKKSDD